MLKSRVVVDGPGVRVAQVHCPGHERRFGAPEPVSWPRIVLPSRGVFRLRVGGHETVVDSATVYLSVPGPEQQFAHPAGGDVCTSVDVGVYPDGVELAALGYRAAPVAPSLSLAHRLLLGRARGGATGVELTDLATALAAEALAALGAAPSLTGSEPALVRQRRLIDDARELLSREPDLSLPDLAAQVGASPWRLSRLFHRLTGVTLHRYRTRLRVNAALERLADGAGSLATLAAELGFADQAHLTRVVRDSTGLPPGRLRSLLAPAAVRSPVSR
jgi:AraC-like DNA-binding protein